MPTPSEIMDASAALLNDTAQDNYTDAVQLPYLNIALDELQELFEQNNIPISNKMTSPALTVPIGTTVIGQLTTPALPTDLIEIQQLWESPSGTDTFVPMTRKEFIPHYVDGLTYTAFVIWAWIGDEIHLPEANSAIDIKLDYIKSTFSTPILIADIAADIAVKNIKTFLTYRTAALCAQFIGEDKTRSDDLNVMASLALDRELGISTKGRQAIFTRRRPFRAGYKARTIF